MAYLSTSPILRQNRRSVFALFSELRALRRQRRQLAMLTDAELSDIGITRAAAMTEAARAAWDFPCR